MSYDDADDVDRTIALVQSSSGDLAALRIRADLVQRLVKRGNVAEDRLLEIVSTDGGVNRPALFDALATFETERAADVLLERLDTGPEAVSEAAAAALARHPSSWALAALERAAESARDPTAIAALGALLGLGHIVQCDRLAPLFRRSERRIRYLSVQLGKRGHCLTDELRANLLCDERDAEIQALLKT